MRYFDREFVERTLSPALALQLSQEAFALVSRGEVEQTLRSVIASGEGSLMGTMPAYIRSGPYAGFGLKTVKVDFSQPGRASHEGAILLYDAFADGGMAMVDAGSVTEIRTAAASALATKLLSPPDAGRLAILGTGVQARKHVQMLLAVRPIRQISLWGRSPERVAQFAEWCGGYNLPVTIADTPAQAVRDADIICTLTAAKEPFLHQRDLPPRCHINAVGASARGFQELAADVYSAVELYVDSREAVWHASDCLNQAREQGLIAADRRGKEIGEQDLSTAMVTGSTLFKSVGVAAQDLVFARALVALAGSVE